MVVDNQEGTEPAWTAAPLLAWGMHTGLCVAIAELPCSKKNLGLGISFSWAKVKPWISKQAWRWGIFCRDVRYCLWFHHASYKRVSNRVIAPAKYCILLCSFWCFIPKYLETALIHKQSLYSRSSEGTWTSQVPSQVTCCSSSSSSVLSAGCPSISSPGSASADGPAGLDDLVHYPGSPGLGGVTERDRTQTGDCGLS